MLRLGMDIGSTTLKCVVLNEDGKVIYSDYQRHFSKVKEKVSEMMGDIEAKGVLKDKFSLCISGSAGMGFAERLKFPFVQEVYATRLAVKEWEPDTDVVIELGGEDAKILFLQGAMEVRMNGSCAGGTGAFVDQMATLLGVEPLKLNELASSCEKIYSIASRCGVFAKTDVQPLLNQGAKKEDISASIFQAVVNQTIAGLAQGREIEGNVLYLGGPLTFFDQLRKLFDETLKLKGKSPENSLYYVALGAAISPEAAVLDMKEFMERCNNMGSISEYRFEKPLFENREQYDKFIARHEKSNVVRTDKVADGEKVYIGIDSGSTTLKCVAVNEKNEIIMDSYQRNMGNPVDLVKKFLDELYAKYPNIKIGAATSTGYGEELVKEAFHLDFGVVETMAHFTAAKFFEPQVDFIIDIGGQDIKCFQIRNSAIDNIFLNEACSSGCGSFLQTFAGALGYEMEEFANMGLFADKPVDLGSRCTVFMNSSVKQAQKDGATIENISAGLSISVVKNALYKVIRITDTKELGKHIVVQGGTFLNNAVLRSFEKEIGHDVVRPEISGLMGAFGAALYGKVRQKAEESSILNKEAVAAFSYKTVATTCQGCSNHCQITVNTFPDGRRFVGGQRCEKGSGKKASPLSKYNMYQYKRDLLDGYADCQGERGTIGIPMGLNMLELYPFWHTLFKELKFGVMRSGESDRALYVEGQHTIPSDTVCYPAKLLHGHIERLMEKKPDMIFYPCMTYNLDEGLGDNHYNCPVVAYYPEVIGANVKKLKEEKFLSPYVGIHRKKDFVQKFHGILSEEFADISVKEVKKAVNAAYKEYESYMDKIRTTGKEYLEFARKNNHPVIVLSGRPYHIDKEISHGIDQMICEQGVVVITEDSISDMVEKFPCTVLNQWTYHSRLYAAAKYIANKKDPMLNLIQLVSFGCGVDAITTDEVRSILEPANKIYTQIKIDEITNLGAVKIRVRSLFAAIEGDK